MISTPKWAYSLLCLPIFISCDKETEPAPSYLHIEACGFDIVAGQGTGRQKISDAWIYLNNNYVGAYELPLTIPVIAEGTSEILILPGIRINGQITHAGTYALLEPFTSGIIFNAGDTTTVSPVTSYQSGLKFPFIEDFEGFHFFNIDRDGNLETKVLLTDQAEAFEGNYSGIIELTEKRNVLYAVFDLEKIIPQSPDPIILELHYKSDIPFNIGFVGDKGAQGEDYLVNATLLPKLEWTKVYFDFREIINLSNAFNYRLAINASFIPDSAKATQKILIDNIKVVHR